MITIPTRWNRVLDQGYLCNLQLNMIMFSTTVALPPNQVQPSIIKRLFYRTADKNSTLKCKFCNAWNISDYSSYRFGLEPVFCWLSCSTNTSPGSSNYLLTIAANSGGRSLHGQPGNLSLRWYGNLYSTAKSGNGTNCWGICTPVLL